MASLFGHVLGAEAALGLAARLGPPALATRRAMWLAGTAAVVPDLDTPFYLILGKPDWLAAHRGPTHSLAVAGLVALAATVACLWGRSKEGASPGRAWLQTFLAFAAISSLHLVLDWLMSVGPAMPWLWPLANAPWGGSPVQLVPTAYYGADDWGGFFGVAGMWQTWVGMLLDAVIFIPLIILAWGKAEGRLRWAMAALSATGLLLTWLLYQAIDLL